MSFRKDGSRRRTIARGHVSGSMSKNRRHRGFSAVYAIVCMVTVIGFVSLAVDLGRVQTAKTELRRAADAAARYAATGIRDNTARDKAVAAAAQNSVDGSPLVIDS